MTRFDEVARLKELEKKATPAPWNRPGGHLIEDGPTTADGIDCIRRLRRAMEIMEGQE